MDPNGVVSGGQRVQRSSNVVQLYKEYCSFSAQTLGEDVQKGQLIE